MRLDSHSVPVVTELQPVLGQQTLNAEAVGLAGGAKGEAGAVQPAVACYGLITAHADLEWAALKLGPL